MFCVHNALNYVLCTQYTVLGSVYTIHLTMFCADMEKDNFLTQARIDPKLFYSKNCVNFKKSELAKKTASNVFEHNKTATHLKRQELCN